MPRVMGTLGSPGPAWFLLGSKRPLQSLGWLPMDVPQFTISPPKPPGNGCCTEATIVSDVPVPAVSTRSTTLCWAGSWRVAGATRVHFPSLRTRAWAPRRGLGHWACPGRQAPGTSSPLSAEDVLLRGGERPHQASVGPAGWTSALQQQRGGCLCRGGWAWAASCFLQLLAAGQLGGWGRKGRNQAADIRCGEAWVQGWA